MEDEIFEENQILKHLEVVIEEVIVWALHREMVVMSSPQCVISYHETNVFMQKDSFFEHNHCSLSKYVSDKVCSLPVSFTQDTFSLQFDFQDQIGIWLVKSFMDRYPLFFNVQIMFLVNKMLDELILSIFKYKII